MKLFKFLILVIPLFLFCAKRNPEVPKEYHPDKWVELHHDKVHNMGTYEPCLRCHAMEGESPLEEAPSCRSCHTSEPEIQ